MFGWFGGPGLSGTIQGFQQGLGFPPALAVLAAVAEFFGALGVLVGLLTRVAAAGITVVMLVAMFKVHWANGFFLNWLGTPGVGHGIEMNLALLGLALALVIAGGGALSLDRRLST
jgi:putative oxidoreductase